MAFSEILGLILGLIVVFFIMEINSLAHEIINPLNIIIGYAELSKLEKIPESVNKNISKLQYPDLISCKKVINICEKIIEQ